VIAPGSPQNRFVGAGIVQKVGEGEAGGSGYVLMAPSGKILADLKPTGNVRLEDFAGVGQQVGVQGSRWSEKEETRHHPKSAPWSLYAFVSSIPSATSERQQHCGNSTSAHGEQDPAETHSSSLTHRNGSLQIRMRLHQSNKPCE
jgi:hypothetical protein